MNARLNVILFLTIGLTALAQKNVQHNNREWIHFTEQIKFNSKLTWLSDASVRFTQQFENFSQFTIRTGVQYALADNLSATIGLACFTSLQDKEISVIELRPYQDFISVQKFGNLWLQHRLRAEQRIFYNQITSAQTFNHRFRYRFTVSIPLSKAKENLHIKWKLLLGDEIFVNAGKEIKYNMLDNNRILTGINFSPAPSLNILFQYVYQYGQRSTAALYEHSDIFWLSISHVLIRKNKQEK